jgi:hypothetical protein
MPIAPPIQSMLVLFSAPNPNKNRKGRMIHISEVEMVGVGEIVELVAEDPVRGKGIAIKMNRNLDESQVERDGKIACRESLIKR